MTLKKCRKQIDKIDSGIVKLLAKRKKAVLKLWAWKEKEKMPLYDEEREREINNRVMRLAKRKGLSSRFVGRLFRRIIKSNK